MNLSKSASPAVDTSNLIFECLTDLSFPFSLVSEVFLGESRDSVFLLESPVSPRGLLIVVSTPGLYSGFIVFLSFFNVLSLFDGSES